MNGPDQFNIEAISLEDISIIGAGIVNENNLAAINKDDYNHDITYNFQFGASSLQKLIRVVFSCTIKTFNLAGEEVNVGGNFNIGYFFRVSNLEELFTGTNDNLSLPNELFLSLANITYSTSRGVIYTRCQGTVLNNVILPILSTKKLADIL